MSPFLLFYIGITTLVGGGTGPADGTRATTCTPAPIQMQMMLQSTDDLPLNFGFNGKVCFSFLFIYNACSFFVSSSLLNLLCWTSRIPLFMFKVNRLKLMFIALGELCQA